MTADIDLSRAVAVLLSVHVAQVRAVIGEIGLLGDPLVGRFAELADCLRNGRNGDTDGDDPDATEQAERLVLDCMTRLQKLDAIEQRLDHIALGLDQISSLVTDQVRPLTDDEWSGAQARLRAVYKMAEERDLMDDVLGVSTDRTRGDGGSGDVEFFG